MFGQENSDGHKIYITVNKKEDIDLLCIFLLLFIALMI